MRQRREAAEVERSQQEAAGDPDRFADVVVLALDDGAVVHATGGGRGLPVQAEDGDQSGIGSRESGTASISDSRFLI